jgi:hypothetical protein
LSDYQVIKNFCAHEVVYLTTLSVA